MNPRNTQFDSNSADDYPLAQGDAPVESNINESALLSEFKANLAQQTFGIASYQFIHCSPTNIVAKIALTDGQLCSVDLSSRGYEIMSLTGSESASGSTSGSYEVAKYPIFESLDSLLRSVSLEYKLTWDRTLLDRLSALRE